MAIGDHPLKREWSMGYGDPPPRQPTLVETYELIHRTWTITTQLQSQMHTVLKLLHDAEAERQFLQLENVELRRALKQHSDSESLGG